MNSSISRAKVVFNLDVQHLERVSAKLGSSQCLVVVVLEVQDGT